ncbi:unnamed protein product [Mytilus edulis]|uniref:Uncharacterized protein n=1 Tax=Mytilus edulis TaxID=6550 RepID=A0A8S3UFT4_MYTED|nr:unnamed protein product [Mytilus edulis]
MRTTTADPIIKTYTEGERAYLACSVKFKEIIDLTSINYSNDTCIHSERYGIGNLCNGKTDCSFDVSNSNIGSSCGANGTATLEVRYNCIQATWNDWSSWSECTRSCSSGIQTRQRQCLNQMNTTDGYVTECEGIGTGSRSCNTELCPYCNDNNFQYPLPQSLLVLNDDSISESDLHKTTKLCVSDAERIAVTQGDIIGWQVTVKSLLFGSGNSVGYYECIPTTTKPCPVSFKLNVPVNEGDIIDIDTLSNASDRIYALNYSTTIRSVHVKKPLPHVIGQKNTTLNFTCAVQDSCLNLASTTITIISHNAPPVVTELPDMLKIDLEKIQDDSSFYIFHVEDPSTDNVSCALSRISLSMDELTLKMDGNGI